MTESWAMNAARSIFALIDRAIYSLIAIVYEILIKLSEVTIFSNEAINDFSTRAYSLLGIIMLFKVTFSFINYIVNPDQLSDKAKGAQKIIVNIIISLGLIIITPFAFTKLYELQTAILQDNIIPRFILGTEGGFGDGREYQISEYCGEDDIASAKTDGDYISIIIFRPFYQLEESKRNLNSEDREIYCKIGTVGTRYATVSQYLSGNIYNDAPGGTKEIYTIDYQFFISTIVGVVVLLILISFCFDIAIRSIKLGFLQIIAPIPIISYVDPDSSKNGMFKKWLKEVGKTWADMFIRLIALFLGVYIIKYVITQGELSDLSGNPLSYKFWIDLFIIIGALMFAKKLPQLLSDILGIKLDGGFTLNPMKRIRDTALGGKTITGGLKAGAAVGVGAALGVGANTYKLASDIKKDGLKKALMGENTGAKGAIRGVGTVLGLGAGGFSAGARGAYNSFKNDSLTKGVSQGMKQSVDNRTTRDKRADAGYGILTRGADSVRAAVGVDTSAKFRGIELGNSIAGQTAAIANIQRQQQTYMMDANLEAEQLTLFNSITKDAKGNYIFKDNKTNKEIARTADLKGELEKLLTTSGLGGKTFTAGSQELDAAIKYIQSSAQINDLNKVAKGLEKQQALYQREDSNKQK